jgi:hypothetical protein
MAVECLLIKSDLGLVSVADTLCQLLALPDKNASGLLRLRDSENRGGQYCLFEVLGLQIFLLRNTGESRICEDTQWGYYLDIDNGVPYDRALCDSLFGHIFRVLTEAGVAVRLMERQASPDPERGRPEEVSE